MKKMAFRIVAALGLLLAISAVASAQSALPGSGWYTPTTIQNVSSTTGNADVTLQVYQSGTEATASQVQFQLAQGANRVFVPGGNNANGSVDVSPSLPGGFSGSMVALSNQPIAAIGQISNFRGAAFPTLGVPGGYASEFFRGSDAQSSTLIYPVVKNNYFGKTTIFSIQAAGADVSLTATIKDGAGGTHTKSIALLKANRSVVIGPADFSPALGSGCTATTQSCFGALTVVATGGNIAGVALEYAVGVSPATIVQSASMFGSNEADTTVNCPTIKNSYTATQKRTTGMSVANVTGSPVTVDITFAGSAGAGQGQTYAQNGVVIPAGGQVTFSAFTNNIGGMPAGTLGSAKVTSRTANSIVAVVNESNFGTSPVKSVTYNCMGAASATSRVAAPLVKKNLGGSTSGVTVQNVDASATNVTVTYTCNTGTFSVSAPSSLNAGAAYTFFNPSKVPDGSNCGATIDGGGKKIIAIIQETSDFLPQNPALNTKNYEGFNL